MDLKQISPTATVKYSPTTYPAAWHPFVDVVTSPREMLLTLPAPERTEPKNIRVEAFKNDNGGTDYQTFINGNKWIVVGGVGGEQGAVANARRLWMSGHTINLPYTDGHYADTPNTVANVLLADIDTGDGKRTLDRKSVV